MICAFRVGVKWHMNDVKRILNDNYLRRICIFLRIKISFLGASCLKRKWQDVSQQPTTTT